jgi:hypothetical protein
MISQIKNDADTELKNIKRSKKTSLNPISDYARVQLQINRFSEVPIEFLQAVCTQK